MIVVKPASEIYPAELTAEQSARLYRMGYQPEGDTFYMSPGKCAAVLVFQYMKDKKRNERHAK